MFYNYAIATTCGVIGGVCVYEKEDYRKMIIEMVNKIENLRILKMIWGFVRSGYKEEKAGG